jgi:phage-related protein
VATTAATLAIKVVSDTSGATKGLDAAAGRFSKFESGLRSAAIPAGAAVTALAAFGKGAFDAASAAEQAGGAVDAVFGKAAKAIHGFAETSAEDAGLSAGAYEDMAAKFGAQLKNMGVAAGDLAPQTDELISLGADLAAQYGGSTADAVEALGSLLRGETDPIEKYGVSIKASDVAAQKAAMGLDDLTGAADKQATTQATLALLTKQTASAQGAFAREADTAAGAQQRASASWEDAQAALGEALLPVVSKAAEMFGKFANFVENNKTAVTIFATVIGVLATAVIGLNIALAAMNAVLAINPIVLIVVAVVALIAGLVLLYKKCTAFRNIVDTIGRIAKAVFLGIVAVVRRVIEVVVRVARAVGRGLAAAFRVAKTVGRAVFMVLKTAVKIYLAPVLFAIKLARAVLPAAFRVLKTAGVAVFNAIKFAVKLYLAPVLIAIKLAKIVLPAAFRVARDVARTVFSAIKAAIQFVIDKGRDLVAFLRGTLNAMFRTVRQVARTAFNGVKAALGFVIDKATALYNYLADTLEPVFSLIGDTAATVLGAITTAFDGIASAVETVVGWVQSLIDFLGDIPVPHIDWPSPPGWLDAINPFSAVLRPPMPSPAPMPRGRAAGAGSAVSASAGGITINVTGALDPDAVARQIDRIIRGRARRVGGVRSGAPLGAR